MALSAGTKAPNFSSTDDKGNSVSLSDFSGKTVVIYFYPKDDTPGCTKQACSFRDSYSEYQGKDIVV
ncbi:MAG: redoxin domain-containing protein, partial [Cyanobacteria bacterium J06643_4]